VVLGVLLVGNDAALLIPAFDGQQPQGAALNGSMLLTTLFLRLWYKRQGRKGWHGALIGFGLGAIVGVAAEVIFRSATTAGGDSRFRGTA
jgi:hypothetical protein